ncbi:MAG TPA: sigma 54-interacting transcriptional regulator [Thermoanaerobaculia bacterium]|nr:sigma 54-interacting transcriptional regulator [Thermoanaerobaculia bacterium]
MAMRRGNARKRSLARVALAEFGWEPAVIAALRHSTLPWTDEQQTEIELEATPLESAGSIGRRDAFSLLGQYAAHLAFLRQLALDDAHFDPSEWGIGLKRGTDCRLVRLRGVQSSAGDTPPLTLLEAFAAQVGAPRLATFDQSWAKPEAVYHELHTLLRGDIAADLSWFHAAAVGVVRPPGIDSLRAILRPPAATVVCHDAAAASTALFACSIAGFDDAFLFGGPEASPLDRLSAIDERLLARIDRAKSRGDDEVAEALLAVMPHPATIILRDCERFDAASATVASLLARFAPEVTWVVPPGHRLPLSAESSESDPSKLFLLSPRLVPREQLQARLEPMSPAERETWAGHFVRSESYWHFCEEGAVPEPEHSGAIAALAEPRRSYLAALALIDDEVPSTAAEDFLTKLGSHLAPVDLIADGIFEANAGGWIFPTPALREQLARSIPAGSRPALCRLGAAVLADSGCVPLRAAALHQEGGEGEKATAILEQLPWESMSARDVVAALRQFPLETIVTSNRLLERLASALLAEGEYRQATAAASRLEGSARAWISAAAARRLGDYAKAAEHLAAIEPPTFESVVLEGELMRLEGEADQARRAFARAASLAGTPEERTRLAYEQWLLALEVEQGEVDDVRLEEQGETYYGHRYRGYRALTRGEYQEALVESRAALDQAPDLASKIDAGLDIVYGSFLAGSWETARHEARRLLALVEETDGDRAAGGVLFTLAYLCADEGLWDQAEQITDRLRRFYASRGDSRRLSEVDLLVAHRYFGRGELANGRIHASAVLERCMSREMREAAGLILDESDWIEGKSTPLRSGGDSSCVELTDRHLLLVSRRGDSPDRTLSGDFARALEAFEREEREGRRPQPPSATTGSERLRLMRSLMGLARATSRAGLLEEAARIAGDFGIELDGTAADQPHELRVLQRLATASYPFEPHDLGAIRWRFASRNRLGVWSEIGSLPPLSQEDLARIHLALPESWRTCGDSALLFVDGLDGWSSESQRAAVALFHIRSEHHRFRRALRQEEASRPEEPSSIEGIIGISPPIADVISQVHRLRARDVPVCILGESGTGKELAARAIHRTSQRRNRAFTAVNCAALPENLVESELFGHVRGAFTGADRDRLGLIESSDGGTLFLDEIGELPLPAQAKLLRFLQEGEFRRVGETATRTADVRIIAATNRRLEEAVDEGQFREDLYYRVKVVELRMPPLRERGGDVLLLARHFLERERVRHRAGPDSFSDEVAAVITSYRWPGNVRELENTIRASHALAGESRAIDLEHLPERLRNVRIVRSPSGTYFEEVTRFRKSLVERSLLEAKGNQNQAARLLGMSRQALAYQIRELGIMVRDARREEG